MNRLAEQAASRAGRSVVPTLLIWLAFVGWSLARVPVPGVNEPHYLSKSRHFWNPEWCRGDFFLDSSNPHWVFYCTFGRLAELCTLPTAAVAGRTLGLLLVACGWQRLCEGITGRRWIGLLSVPLLLMLQSLGNFSGEWLIGGIEAKVPAYGCLFWGLGDFLQRRYLRGASACGLAISLHPLVGIWRLAALGLSLLPTLWQGFRRRLQPSSEEAASLDLPGLGTWALMGGLCLLLALPGLIPALAVVGAENARLELFANQLQVADRLAHHLDPMRFSKESYRYWGMMIVLWLLLAAPMPRTAQRRWWKTYVWCTIAIALIGIAVGWGPRPVDQMASYAWRLKLLKFYFFRLGDLFVPMALALCVTERGLDLLLAPFATPQMKRVCLGGLFAIILGSLLIPFPDANPSRMNARQQADWQQVCQWIQSHSSPDDLVYATDTGWAIKWFAQRPEYVSFKDMPQDAASIVEWNRRLWVMANWRAAAMQDGEATSVELQSLRKETGIHFMICGRFGPVVAEPVFSNGTFRVYELPGEF